MKRSTAVLLVLLIVGLLTANSVGFFFQTPYYETWDSAANSLAVREAKHFARLYGPYSRWEFHHPGPALFYVQALGEWIFHDVLRVVPAPFNGQTLLYLFVSVGFFVAALRVCARWIPAGRARWWFLCVALGLGILHFTAVNAMPSYDPVRAPTVFLSLWSAHALTLPFVCLLAAGASVAAGRADDLPLLALADGFLLHTHVAQPLFVVPLTAVACAGMWRRLGGPLAAWRKRRRTHLIAAGIAAVFALPLAVDACCGHNLAAIFRHLRTHHGEHKPFTQSLFYFLQFGAYQPFEPGRIELRRFDGFGAWAYVRTHWGLYATWAAVAGTAVWALARELWERTARRTATRRFLAWGGAFTALAVALTLSWGMMQDGEMFYYNAWFNFGLYFFGLLVAVGVGCERTMGETTFTGREQAAGVAGTLALGVLMSGALRISDPDPKATRAMHESIRQVIEAQPSGARVAALRFPLDEWALMAGVALQVERSGLGVCVPEGWKTFFGERRGWDSVPSSTVRAGAVEAWRFEHLPGFEARGITTANRIVSTPVALASDSRVILPDDLAANREPAVIDLNQGGDAIIRFSTGGNAADFVVGGWSGPEAWGTWSESRETLLEFRAVPATGDGDVEIVLAGVHPHLHPERGLKVQRLTIYFNGEALEGERRVEGDVETLAYRISLAQWNRAESIGKLAMFLPDAASPASLDPTGKRKDKRALGIGLREVRFTRKSP